MIDASATQFTYAIALGSNRPLARNLGPLELIDAAIEALDSPPLSLLVRSATMQSRPIGPSRRRYANAAVIIETTLAPPALLIHLQDIENRYGRRRHRRWGARTLDIDIILWSAGIWTSPKLAIPHVAFRKRNFVLRPLATIIPAWRDPLRGLTVRQLAERLGRRKPVDQHANPL